MRNLIASAMSRLGIKKTCKHRRATVKEATDLGFRKYVNHKWVVDTDRCAICQESL